MIYSIGKSTTYDFTDFTVPLVLYIGTLVLSIVLSLMLVIFSERIAFFLLRPNDKDWNLLPQWNVYDILYVSIQILALGIIIKSVSYFLRLLATGIYLMLHRDLIENIFDAKQKFELGGEAITAISFVIFGVSLIFFSNKIINLLDRFYRKRQVRPNESLNTDG